MPGMGGGYDPNMGGINQGGPGPAPGALTDAQRWVMQNRPGQQWYSPGNYPGGNNSNPGQQGGGDWETAGGGAWNAGQRVDPGGWTYSTNYSGKIPEGARTFNPNTPPGQRDPRTGAPLHMNPLWTQGGSEYYWLNEDGTPAGSTGFTGSNVSNAPWNATPQVRGGGSQMGQQGGGGGGQPGGLGQYGGGGGGQQFGLGGGGQMANLMGSMYGNRRF